MSKYWPKVGRINSVGHTLHGKWVSVLRTGPANSRVMRLNCTKENLMVANTALAQISQVIFGKFATDRLNHDVATGELKFPLVINMPAATPPGMYRIAGEDADPTPGGTPAITTVPATGAAPAVTPPAPGPGATPGTSPGLPVTPVAPATAPARLPRGSRRVPRGAAPISNVVQNDTVPKVRLMDLPRLLQLVPAKRAKMLWSPPGLGKSESINQFAEEIHARVWDIRLGQYDPQEIKGIMIPDTTSRSAYTLRPDFFPLENYTEPCVIFFDEITSAPPMVSAAAYQIVLDRRAGVHKLPAHAHMFCAGNRENDRGVVYKMPSPLANRMFHVEITPDIVSWRRWAITHGVDARIVSFLTAHPDFLFQMNATTADKAWCSPRSWTFAAESIQAPGITPYEISLIVAGWVGTTAAKELERHLATLYARMPVLEILNGTNSLLGSLTPDCDTALAIALVANSEIHQVTNILTKAYPFFCAEGQMITLVLLLEKYTKEVMIRNASFASLPRARAAVKHFEEGR